jgi:hypothetical protein
VTELRDTAAESLAFTVDAIKQSLSTSETILSSASEYLGSIAGIVRDDQTVVNYGRDDAARVEGWIKQSHADIHPQTDTRTDENLDEASILGLAAIAEEHFVQGEYADAERFLTKFLEMAEA